MGYTAAVITVSDKGARGERVDTSGPRLVSMLKEHGYDDFELKACSCDGIEACRVALLKKNRGILDANFIEGMACVGGCIGGAGCLTHGEKNKAEVDKYGKEALEKTITDAISVLKD